MFRRLLLVLRVGSDRPGSRFCSIAAALQCIRRHYPGLESGDARYERRRQSPFDSGSGRPDSNITSIRDRIRGDVQCLEFDPPQIQSIPCRVERL